MGHKVLEELDGHVDNVMKPEEQDKIGHSRIKEGYGHVDEEKCVTKKGRVMSVTGGR